MAVCRECLSPVLSGRVEGYPFYCLTCQQDLYGFECDEE